MAFQATFVQAGNAIDYTPDADVAAGAVVVQNSLVGVTTRPIAANQPGALAVVGVFDVVKDAVQINAGAGIFWDEAAEHATTESEGNAFMGFSLLSAAADAETVRVLLVPITSVANTIHNDLTHLIADPGADGAIPVADSGSCAIVTVGSEARTLGDPSDVGQLLALTLKGDGGDCTVTADHGVNQAGNDTLTFNDAGDALVLIGTDVGGAKRWRVLANDGVDLTTA